VADRKTKEPLAGEKCGEIAFKLLNKGVLMTPCGRYGNVFRFMPPLTVPHDYAMKAIDITLDILKDY
jgi:4-aminobutyrate aminotransferase